MEELFKLLLMQGYLEGQNVKDTTTFERIAQLKKEANILSDKLAQQYLAEKFPT